MKNRHYTVVVVGGGPAGSSAAYTLAKHGVDVCVVDKAIFPRDKLCGGLLTLRSKKIFSEIFDAPWNKIVDYTSHGVTFYHKERQLNRVENYSDLYFTKRFVFDDYLLSLAKKKGSTLDLGNGITSIDVRNRSCVTGLGDVVTYDYLIGADGVNSRVSKALFGEPFNKEAIAFALEIEVDRAFAGRDLSDPEIYFGIVRWGYGWVFPKKQTLTVGIGGIRSKNQNLKPNLNAFLQSLFGDIPKGKIKGHHIPFGNYRKSPGLDNILLAGDAAGLVDPITGEGIAFAMQSGYYSALSIIESINQKDEIPVLDIYKEKYVEISSALDRANMLRYLIFPGVSENLFVRALPKTKRLPLKHMDLMADNIKYDEYVRYVIPRVFKSVLKRLFLIKR